MDSPTEHIIISLVERQKYTTEGAESHKKSGCQGVNHLMLRS